MTFKAVADKHDDGPDFIVIAYGEFPDVEDLDFADFDPTKPVRNPNTYQIGAAWKKTSKKGKPYLSVKLDSPTVAAAIHCALTERNDGSYHLIWSRKDGEPAAEQAAA